MCDFTKFNNNYYFFIKVVLIVKIDIKELLNNSLNLALIQWYDFKHKNSSYLYECSQLKLIENYNFINIEAIQDIEHIISRFNLNNKYFVNKFIF